MRCVLTFHPVILPSSLRPTFKLSSPLMDSLTPLLRSYLHRATQLYDNVMTTSSYAPPNAPQLLDMFSAPTEANQEFLTSAAALVEFLDRQASRSTKASGSSNGYASFGAFEISGLKELARQYGTDSNSYKSAVTILQTIIFSAMSREDLHLAVLTFAPETYTRVKRQDEDDPQSPFPIPTAHPAEPIGPTCFQSVDACSNATDACSGHGECVRATKAGRTCYVCACSATVDDDGRKEDWAGAACERKDVSGYVPRHLGMQTPH